MAKKKPNLKDYTDDPAFSRQWQDDAIHDRHHMEEAYRIWTLGINMAREVHTPGTAFREMLGRAAKESAVAMQEFIDCDLNSNAGIDRGKALQGRVIRYRELIQWTIESINLGNDAAEDVQQHENEKLRNGISDSGDFDASERPV